MYVTWQEIRTSPVHRCSWRHCGRHSVKFATGYVHTPRYHSQLHTTHTTTGYVHTPRYRSQLHITHTTTGYVHTPRYHSQLHITHTPLLQLSVFFLNWLTSRQVRPGSNHISNHTIACATLSTHQHEIADARYDSDPRARVHQVFADMEHPHRRWPHDWTGNQCVMVAQLCTGHSPLHCTGNGTL